MKACRTCGRLYPDDAGFCPIDGTQLIRASLAPVTSSEQDSRVGQVLCGRYQVRRVVADGGMGRVYEALDAVEKKNVALKVLHRNVVDEPIALERFKREFEVSKLLPHDHIVEVIAFESTGDGTFALVMEFLYGEELRSTLKRETVLKPGRIVRMLSQVALALDEAHERGFVHRDLKPENVFLCQTRAGDTVKLLDFGSVKDNSEAGKKLTILGTTIGSPYYMSPEQAQGLDTLDRRADVWSLAAIIYECVTGSVPFVGNTGPAILLQILNAEPQPPSKAGIGQKYPIPTTLDRVLLHAFKKNQNLRIGSVGALADAVGLAYGLNDTHEQWARTNEAELTQQIDLRWSELLRVTNAKLKSSVSDEFFGEREALNALGDPRLAPKISLPVPAPSSLPLGVPFHHFPWRTLVAVGAGALALGVALALLAYWM